MRAVPAALLIALAVAALGCRDRWALGPLGRGPAPAAEPVRWVPLSPDEVTFIDQHGTRGRTRFEVRLPPPDGGGPAHARLEVRFRAPLDGAKVDADGWGPRHRLRLLDGQRVRGDTVSITLAPFALERLAVDVHHHLRPAPILAEVRLGRPVGR